MVLIYKFGATGVVIVEGNVIVPAAPAIIAFKGVVLVTHGASDPVAFGVLQLFEEPLSQIPVPPVAAEVAPSASQK